MGGGRWEVEGGRWEEAESGRWWKVAHMAGTIKGKYVLKNEPRCADDPRKDHAP